MDRAYASGSSGSAPSAPASPSIGYPTAGNPGTVTPATKPGPWWYHMVTEEMRKVITDAGLTPDHTNLGQLSAAIAALINAALPAQVKIPVRQTVLGGPVDSSSYPSFLPATAGSLSLTSQNVAAGAPLVVAAANGFGSAGAVDRVGISTSNLTWSGLTANTTNYLYVDVAANGTLTPGSTTLSPVYQNGGTRSTTNGQATFNIAEMIMTVGNGSSAVQTYRVFVGEAVTNASTVTSTVAYAYQGLYDTGWFAVSNSSNYAKNHNIGHLDLNTQTWVNSTASEAGKYQADTSGGYTGTASISSGVYKKFDTRNSMTFQTGSAAVFAIYRGGPGDINLGSSAFCRSVVKRGW